MSRTNNSIETIVAIANEIYGCDPIIDEIEMNPDGSCYIQDPISDGEIGDDLEIQVREDGYYYRLHPFFCDAEGYYEEPSEWTLYIPGHIAEAIDEMVENISSPDYTEELTTVRDLKIMRGTEIEEVCRRYDQRIKDRKATLRAEGRWFDRKEEHCIPLSRDAVVCSLAGSAADSVIKTDDIANALEKKAYAIGRGIAKFFVKKN
jgi:hypothetical protein